MAGNIKFWIPKNRFYELKYHCLQYFHFKDLVSRKDVGAAVKEGAAKAIFNIENAVQDVNCTFPGLILEAVTKNIDYSKLLKRPDMPSKEDFEDAYRKFFYFLSKRRGI